MADQLLLEAPDKARENPQVAGWLKEIQASQKREKDWRKEGRALVAMYEGGKAKEIPFNILYSNTETLAPAVYNNTPRPIVERRYKDEDKLGKVAADVTKRLLVFLMDNELENYTPFDDCMQSAVLESLVPGRGVTWFKYDARFEQMPVSEQADPLNVKQETAAGDNASAEPGERVGGDSPAPPEQVSYEMVCADEVPWDRFLMGYAKKWKSVPWVARLHFFDRQELIDNFGEELGNAIPLTTRDNPGKGENDDRDGYGDPTDAAGATLAEVWEIWDKASRKVYFLCPAYKAAFLRTVDDPLQLSGFFPCPEQLTLFKRISSMVPTPLYKLYEEQAKELNRITTRLNSLIKMCKVRGMYDSTIEGIEKVLKGEDGDMIPAENVAALGQAFALEKALWMMPLEKVITVIQQLYVQRTQCKQVIYEITGISDILRGSVAASESATASEIKNSWGTLRLKRMQKTVAKYTRDCLRIMAEIAVSKLSPETIAQMTGLNFPTQEQKALAQQEAQQAVMTQQQPSPEAMKALALPTWDEILGLLRNDLLRNYRIDIETNSTVDAEATEDKQDMGELLNAIAQFFNGIAPLVEKGIMPFEAAKAMLMAVVRRYKFGPELEDQLAALKEPPRQDPNQDPAKQAELAKVQLEGQIAKQEADARQRELQMEMAFKEKEHQLKMEELERKAEESRQAHQMKISQMILQASMPKVQPKPKAKEGAH